MKQRLKLFFLVLFVISGNISLFAQGFTISGLLDSTLSLAAGAGSAPPFSFGVEEYANIRFQSKIRDRATVYGAVNLIAAAGDYATIASRSNISGSNTSALVFGENYAAGFELERLYFRLNFENADFDGGLMRLPFGFSKIWGSSDFLNPKNPLKPDARPRAVLGTALFYYPADDTKFLFFAAAGREPMSNNGDGTLFGISLDQHWTVASLQTLYSFETPKTGSKMGIHRAGISVKADVEVALVLDALYAYNGEVNTKIDGLSFSFGADYSFLDGNLLILAEYLYSGSSSSTAFDQDKNLLGRFNRNYLYTSLTWLFNDFTNITAALISGFDDVSFTPIITLNHDLFQGATLILTALLPLDRDLFSGDGNRGELGPLPPGRSQGSYFNLTACLRLRF